MMRKLFDPRMRTAIPDHWPSFCTIQQVSTVEEEGGQEIPIGAVDIAGLTRLQCRLAPIIEQTPTDDEQRGSTITGSQAQRNLKINGYFPQIQVRGMQAVVDGVTYQIRGVDSDSELFFTRLRLEIVEPDGQ